MIYWLIELARLYIQAAEGGGEIVHGLIEVVHDCKVEERGGKVIHWLVACNFEFSEGGREMVQRVIKFACLFKGECREGGREMINGPIEQSAESDGSDEGRKVEQHVIICYQV